MVCKAENPILLKIIQKIVHNTQTNFYGKNTLHPTGPYLFKDFIDQKTINILELFNSTRLTSKGDGTNYITFGDTVIICSYDEYRDEQNKFQSGLHYKVLWKQRKIYKN